MSSCSRNVVGYTPEVLVQALSTEPTALAIKAIDGREWTRRQVAEHISCYAQAISGAGIGKRARIAFLADNMPELVFLTLTCLVSDLCVVPLHALGSAADHAYILDDAAIDVLVFSPRFDAHVAEMMRASLRIPFLFSLGASSVGKDLVELAARQTPKTLVPPSIAGTEVCRLSYTGGTTGRPKGVMVSYEAFRHVLDTQLREWEWPTSVRHLVCSPLSHAGASAVLPTLVLGGVLVMMPKFDAGGVLEVIETHRITSTLLVPTMIYALLAHPQIGLHDLSSLETIFYGGSSIVPDQLARAIDQIGLVFCQFYAQAEAPMVVSLLRKSEHDPVIPHRLESCGRPLPGIEVQLRDRSGRVVSDGSPGEMCIRGPIVANGYLGRPEETAEAFCDGWLHTGDIAIMDPGGYLRIVDRRKDMIVSGGYNVFSREVEDALSSHRAVLAAAVIGVPDQRWGEAVKAFIVLRSGIPAPTEQELMAHVRQAKGSYCAPKYIEFLDSIPLTSLGKPDKTALRQRPSN